MTKLIPNFFLIIAVSCNYQELSKYGSLSVIPDSKVFLNLTSFKIGELITFEISMDLFLSHENRNSYTFQIEQVDARTCCFNQYWNNLRTVINNNVTGSSSKKIFKWEEIKQEGKKFIYIILPEPFESFYSFFREEIKIKNTGAPNTKKIFIVL